MSDVHGWYGPPNSRRFHYFGVDGRSLCGKWLVIAWEAKLVGKGFGLASGDCAACKRNLVTRGYVSQDVFDVIGEVGS